MIKYTELKNPNLFKKILIRLKIIKDRRYNGRILWQKIDECGNALLTDSNNRFVSRTCIGEECSVCGKPATNKVGEEIPYDDPLPNRHNLTAYLCAEHFDMIMKHCHKNLKQL